jgi:hypothetical protein
MTNDTTQQDIEDDAAIAAIRDAAAREQRETNAPARWMQTTAHGFEHRAPCANKALLAGAT